LSSTFILPAHISALFGVIPGQNYRHQLELIFNVVGSPSDNYINMTSIIIGDFLRSKWLLLLLLCWFVWLYLSVYSYVCVMTWCWDDDDDDDDLIW